MQTILGASGQIARELARELALSFSDELRLVSRHPQKVTESDTLMSADLLDGSQTLEAVKGSRIVYFAAGLPPDSSLWEQQFPLMLQNALKATRQAGAHFVILTTRICILRTTDFRWKIRCSSHWGERDVSGL